MTRPSWKSIAIVLALILGLVLVCAELVVADVMDLGLRYLKRKFATA